MNDQQFACVDCGKASPPADEGETITKQHGWRIDRKVVGDKVVFEPRCRECYLRNRVSIPSPAKGWRPREK